MKHCDDYIDDETAPPVLRAYLKHARAAGHGMLEPAPHPKLFATYRGERVRVTMASRLGDVGVTAALDREHGYEWRVLVSDLSQFSEAP